MATDIAKVAAVERTGMSADQVFLGRQLFADGDALATRITSLGGPAVSRAHALNAKDGA